MPRDDTDLIDTFEEFFRSYYRNEIGELAQKYPSDQKSLYVDWQDLYRFDPNLADDFRNKPQQLREYAEEALRIYDLPVDVSLGQAHLRVRKLPESTGIREIRSDHRGMLLSVQGIVRKATDVRPKITTAAFECQRCGTLTRIPQEGGEFQEPHECQGCERQGPFRINYDQSEFIDAQKLRVQESPEGLRGGETPQSIDINIEDDITGHVTAGDHVEVTGVLKLEQRGSEREKSAMFDVYMDGMTVEIEDEQFEEMDITEADKKEIIELSQTADIYEQMEGAIAPSIWGYEKVKRAMIFQLFSGVTKELPDGSRTRGDLHMLLIGDPGTGKSALLQYVREIAPRSVYTSGKGSSAAGLTAAAVRDDFGDGQQWTLEAGALVLADQGIAAVDELDKMRSEDQSAMHEALEQQSYHPKTEVLLADGRRVEMGAFVDERMAARPDDVRQGVDCEILPVDDVGIHTVDLEKNRTEKTDVDRVSRHVAPEEFVRITFSNGREVVVTPDHPMFVGTAGDVETVEARDIDVGAVVPAPEKLPNAAEPIELPDERRSEDNDHTLPETLTTDLAEILGLLMTDGHSIEGSSGEIILSNRDERPLERAEHLVSSVFDADSSETTSVGGTESRRWKSTELYQWFESNFPELTNSVGKRRIPALVLGSSEEIIRRFLVGAFAGDGSSDGEAIGFVAGSRELARDYVDALLKIGVKSRIQYNKSRGVWNTHVLSESAAQFVEQVLSEHECCSESAHQFVKRSTDTQWGDDDRPVAWFEAGHELGYERVSDVEIVPNEGEYACEWVYDVTVEPTNTFVGQGVVLHNSISVSKAGINATLKSRCSLLGAANPTYGRFDQYEPIGEQIDLDPPLVSRFDLIFTVTDKPDEEEDAQLADHIIRTNYAGELNTHRQETSTSNYSEEEVERVTDDVAPTIDPELLRNYIAYAKRNCFPTMTEEAKGQIREFYVDLRAHGADEDAPVPVTARKLEALVRLAEASARVRLSDTVEREDARRAIDIAEYCLREIGMDPETGELDADVIETGTSKSQRDRIQNIRHLIATIEEEYDEGAPVDVIVERAEEEGISAEKAEHEIDKLKQKGEVYEPKTDHLRTT